MIKTNWNQPKRSIRFTKEGFDKQQKTYEQLLASRPAVVEDLKKAREMGDLKENGYYRASKLKLSFLDSQLRRIKASLLQAIIVESTTDAIVDVGKTVVLSDGEKETTFHIVGDLESEPSVGKISLLSPLGRALSGKKESMEVLFQSPIGLRKYKVLKII